MPLLLRAAHPRSRGENLSRWSAPRASTGSSPLTRGKPKAPTPLRLGATAHPRSRGENQSVSTWARSIMGSSPLTRGKQVLSESHTAGLGLIPAHAGKTSSAAPNATPTTAHPRSRGENHPLDGDQVARPGSSPLTRGKQGGDIDLCLRGGLIPAHAGKTCPIHGADVPCRAHPRSRGENGWSCMVGGCGWGSSPLTRGKRATEA